MNMKLAVRLNCTSDINIEEFNCGEKNILELFPDTQFYDYTKVYERIPLTKKYKNYDLTFSYDGTNWKICEELLKKGHRVAVVFDTQLPEMFRGYTVIDANKDDVRYLDDVGVICGLNYKIVANDYRNGKYNPPVTPFVTREKDLKTICCSNDLKETKSA